MTLDLTLALQSQPTARVILSRASYGPLIADVPSIIVQITSDTPNMHKLPHSCSFFLTRRKMQTYKQLFWTLARVRDHYHNLLSRSHLTYYTPLRFTRPYGPLMPVVSKIHRNTGSRSMIRRGKNSFLVLGSTSRSSSTLSLHKYRNSRS